MSRTTRGLTLALCMLVGAVAFTGFLANSLAQRAQERRFATDDYSPIEGTTVDGRGWRIVERKDREPTQVSNSARSRSRPSSGPIDAGA